MYVYPNLTLCLRLSAELDSLDFFDMAVSLQVIPSQVLLFHKSSTTRCRTGFSVFSLDTSTKDSTCTQSIDQLAT